MYRIDIDQNTIEPLQKRDFTELGFREREHLQEWLASNPKALGEDLLIIQKEFDGFAETRERLDLLALDKVGNLVIIENKLDDSGRDMVWQALKYASYCSSLSKRQILAIYQKYLNKEGAGEVAEDKLADFYDGIEFEELLLNSGQGQRVILVAAQFRKEVTSTALWLRSHRIDISCILATPYVLSGSLLLNLNQIIPVKEAEEYMIMVSEKEGEERDDRADRPNRMNVRYAFWEQFLPILQSGGVTLFSSVTPSVKSSLREQLPVRGVFVALDFKRHGLEVRLVFRGKFGLAAYKKFDLTGFRSQVDMEVEDADVRGNVHKLSIKHSVNAFDETRWPECNAWLLSTLKKVLGAAKISLPELDIALP